MNLLETTHERGEKETICQVFNHLVSTEKMKIVHCFVILLLLVFCCFSSLVSTGSISLNYKSMQWKHEKEEYVSTLNVIHNSKINYLLRDCTSI